MYNNRPAKLCSVVPPMWHAATPVLAVAKVLFGGRDPMILFNKNDFPVPEKHKKSNERRTDDYSQRRMHLLLVVKHHKCTMEADLHQVCSERCYHEWKKTLWPRDTRERFGWQSSCDENVTLPALPVKKTFFPLSTALRTAACSLFSLRDGRDRMGFLLGFVFTWKSQLSVSDASSSRASHEKCCI